MKYYRIIGRVLADGKSSPPKGRRLVSPLEEPTRLLGSHCEPTQAAEVQCRHSFPAGVSGEKGCTCGSLSVRSGEARFSHGLAEARMVEDIVKGI